MQQMYITHAHQQCIESGGALQGMSELLHNGSVWTCYLAEVVPNLGHMHNLGLKHGKASIL